MMFGGPGHFRGRALIPEPTKLDRSNLPVLKRLLPYAKPYQGKLLLSVAFLLGASLGGVSGPFILGFAIDRFIRSGNARGLALAGIAYLLVSALTWVFSYLQTYLTSQAGHSMIADLRQDLFEHIERLAMKVLDEEETGALMSRVTSDIDSISQVVSMGITSVLSDIVVIVGIVVLLFTMNVKLAMISVAVVPLLAIVTALLQGRMQTAFHKVRRTVAEVNANLEETLSGMKVIQSFNREEDSMSRFQEINASTVQANLQAVRTFAVFFPAVDLIGALATAGIVLVGGNSIIHGEIEVGAFAAFLSYVTRFFMPIREISQIYNMLLAAMVSVQRVFQLMDEPRERPGGIEIGRVKGHVRFENVSFAYEEGHPVLSGISMDIPAGQMVALVGPTGAGKTSIINLLTGMYQPDSGKITIDGTDISRISLESLRRNIGVVLQDNFVFAGTIMDNLRYGRPDASLAEVQKVAEAAGADQFISRMPDGYMTLIGERGAGISVGQKQLIALARALLIDPPILVLDEATSNVDPYTELLIQQAIEKLLGGRTAIVIAHRLSTVQRANNIFVIQEGRVVESGTHEQLLALGGAYRSLYEKQFG
ncbi:MAG TPA: ABC transporter ATP-binding protein [Firmicutes bacterium]|nr:ABC transporter ATP-binding protein [Bacillota bacterium]